jgi:hypothetical protein
VPAARLLRADSQRVSFADQSAFWPEAAMRHATHVSLRDLRLLGKTYRISGQPWRFRSATTSFAKMNQVRNALRDVQEDGIETLLTRPDHFTTGFRISGPQLVPDSPRTLARLRLAPR